MAYLPRSVQRDPTPANGLSAERGVHRRSGVADHVSSLADIVGTFDKPKVGRQREEWRQKIRPNPLFAPLKGRMLGPSLS